MSRVGAECFPVLGLAGATVAWRRPPWPGGTGGGATTSDAALPSTPPPASSGPPCTVQHPCSHAAVPRHRTAEAYFLLARRKLSCRRLLLTPPLRSRDPLWRGQEVQLARADSVLLDIRRAAAHYRPSHDTSLLGHTAAARSSRRKILGRELLSNLVAGCSSATPRTSHPSTLNPFLFFGQSHVTVD